MPACPRRREQDFLFRASAELFTSLVSCLQLGAVGDGEKAVLACSVRGESAWLAVKSIQLSSCMEVT